MLHGVCVDSFNTAYLNLYDSNSDMFNTSGFDRSHIAGSDEPINAHVYSIDMLNPYSKFGIEGPLLHDLDTVVSYHRARAKSVTPLACSSAIRTSAVAEMMCG